MEVSGQLHAQAALLPRRDVRMLHGPQSRSGHCDIQKNLLPLPRIEPRPYSPLLYRLSYPGGGTDVKIHAFVTSVFNGGTLLALRSIPIPIPFSSGNKLLGSH
jgi:hypothetical protein